MVFRLRYIALFLPFFILCLAPAYAQQWTYRADNSIKVYNEQGQLMSMAWCGGANTPQFAMADLDNDGDEDIYIEMGGAYAGDSYQNSLYLNPGQNNNHWIKISLEGTSSNRAAIGAKIKLTFNENGKERSVYREVNSGGSFGSNPLRQHLGIGQANIIDKIEIYWPATGQTQVFRNVTAGQNIRIKEGDSNFSTYKLAQYKFQGKVHKHH